MSLVNKFIMISSEEYYKMCYVKETLDKEMGGYIVEPIAITGKIYGGFEGVPPKEVLMAPEIYGAESIFIFDDEASLRAWQRWVDETDLETEKPKLSVVPFNKNIKVEPE